MPSLSTGEGNNDLIWPEDVPADVESTTDIGDTTAKEESTQTENIWTEDTTVIESYTTANDPVTDESIATSTQKLPSDDHVITDSPPDMTTRSVPETTVAELPATTRGEWIDVTTVDESIKTTTADDVVETTTADEVMETTADDESIETTTADKVTETTTMGVWVEPTFKPTPSRKPEITKGPTKPINTNTGAFNCYCSIGFEDSGYHHLLRNFPNLIPQDPYTIRVIPGETACKSAQQKCDSFCNTSKTPFTKHF